MSDPVIPEPRLRCVGLSAGYQKLAVARDIDLSVGRNEILAVLGPNGAGKTTLLLTMAGLLAPIAGEIRVDGVTLREEHIKGKPAPDSYLRAAQLLDVAPDAAAVFEDALSGVAAGRAGNFGFVVGVDRVGQAEDLRRSGADVVVTDLAELLQS